MNEYFGHVIERLWDSNTHLYQKFANFKSHTVSILGFTGHSQLQLHSSAAVEQKWPRPPHVHE